MQVHRYKTWGEAAGRPETSVRLARLPAGFTLPEDFPEPIRFDEQSRRLVYRGFMCSASYRFLRGLTTDPHFLGAIDELFQATSHLLDGKRPGVRVWRWLAGVALAGVAVWTARAMLR